MCLCFASAPTQIPCATCAWQKDFDFKNTVPLRTLESWYKHFIKSTQEKNSGEQSLRIRYFKQRPLLVSKHIIVSSKKVRSKTTISETKCYHQIETYFLLLWNRWGFHCCYSNVSKIITKGTKVVLWISTNREPSKGYHWQQYLLWVVCEAMHI